MTKTPTLVQPSQELLRDWAVSKLQEVGLTPDPDAEIRVYESEEWSEGCDCCGPRVDYELSIAVNGNTVRTLGGGFGAFVNEIIGFQSSDVPTDEYDAAYQGVRELVHEH